MDGPGARPVGRVQRASPMLNRVGDWVLVVICAGFACLDLIVLFASGRSATWLNVNLGNVGVVGVALGSAAAVVAVALRRHLCLWALVGLSVVSLSVTGSALLLGMSLPPSFAVLFALAVLVTRALHTEPELPAIGATALALLAVIGEPARVQSPGIAPFGQVLCVMGLGGAVIVGLWLRFNDWQRESEEKVVRSDERLELARELHDLVGHYVTGMVVQAQAGQLVAATDPTAAVESFARIEAAGADAMSAVRRMVGDLRDEPLRTPGTGWEEIDRLIEGAVADGVPVRYSIDAAARRVPLELTSSVHRLVAESLTNVRRHGVGVTSVEVTIRAEGSDLVVDVHDDGVSAPAMIGSGGSTFGLVGMRERAQALGGTLFAGPAPAGGWLVSARLPVVSPAGGPGVVTFDQVADGPGAVGHAGVGGSGDTARMGSS